MVQPYTVDDVDDKVLYRVVNGSVSRLTENNGKLLLDLLKNFVLDIGLLHLYAEPLLDDGAHYIVSSCGLAVDPDKNANPYEEIRPDLIKAVHPELPLESIVSSYRSLLQDLDAVNDDNVIDSIFSFDNDGSISDANSDIYDLSDEIVSFYLAKMQHSA